MRRTAVAVLLAAAAGCASAPLGAESFPSQAPLCEPGIALGKVVIAPVTRWRPDQKEPAVREAIAQKAIEAVAPTISCATSVSVLPIAANSTSATALATARKDGAKTVLFVRIDEVGPIAVLSFPALWSTWSDVKFTLDAVDVQTNANVRSIPHRRQKGGALEVRGLGPLQGEMEAALKDVILGAR